MSVRTTILLLLAMFFPSLALSQPTEASPGEVDIIASNRLSSNGMLGSGTWYYPTAIIDDETLPFINRTKSLYLFVHGDLFSQQVPGTTSDCNDGDVMHLFVLPPDQIQTPVDQIPGVLTWHSTMRVTQCSTDTDNFDSRGDQIAFKDQLDANGNPIPGTGSSWDVGTPFTMGGNGPNQKLIIFTRGSNNGTPSAVSSKAYLMANDTWRGIDGKWNLGKFPLIEVAPALRSQGVFLAQFAVTPTPTIAQVPFGGGWSNTYVGFFRFNPVNGSGALKAGAFEMEYSPSKYGSVEPTRVKVMNKSGVMQSLGSSGLLTFEPGDAIKLLTGLQSGEFPVDIYRNGSQLYLMTVKYVDHNSNFPCSPVTQIYEDHKGFLGTTLRVRKLFVNPLGLGSVFREVRSAFRTVTGLVPTDYSVGFAGGARVDYNGFQYLITSQRDATICTQDFVSPFIDLRISTARVTEPAF